MARRGHDAILVTSYPLREEYELGSAVKRINLEIKKIEQSKIKRNISRISKLRKICKTIRPDVCISFMQEPNFRMLCATRGLGIPTVVSVRNDPRREYAGTVGKAVGRYLMPRAEGCVFQTKEAMSWFSPSLQNRSTVIPNPVGDRFFAVGPEREDSQLVVSIGRLEEQKNQALAIDAFGSIARKYPKARFEIYGEGELRTALEARISESGLSDRIALRSKTTDVAGVLSKAAIFVLSSDFEGMPNALQEALATGVACVSTDCPCGGPRSLIENGKNGVLVPVGDEDALAHALDELLGDLSRRQALGQAAKKAAHELFSAQGVFDRWEDYLSNVKSK